MRDANVGRALQPSVDQHSPNAALLIDFDNVTMGIRSDLQSQLHRLMNSEMIKGKVAVQRAYADWRRYPQYIVPLSEASIDLIFAPAFGSNKKNATDIRLAIDALELVFTRPEIGTFILLSGDSDFSSLVLKLKEYGKYVIGVGIRESSSDLLMQNCDEYYSYNDLTGFTKEHEVEYVSKDPWELVVAAIVKMRKGNDVMRSDRLKQVMQGIDPTFSEKDAGFSRFSRFMMEAQKRGLVQLTKLENGQLEVDIGRNANITPEEEVELREQGAADPKEARSKSRRPRRSGGRGRGEGTLTLAEAFELMRQSLLALGAVDEQPAKAESVREKMAELRGEDGDPVFDRPRFQRLLRQAHDADLIELVKQDDDYLMKLNPKVVIAAEAEKQAATGAAAEGGGAVAGGTETTPSKRRPRRPASKARTKSRRTNATSSSEQPVVTPANAPPDEEAKPAKGRRPSRPRRSPKKAASAGRSSPKGRSGGESGGAASGTHEPAQPIQRSPDAHRKVGPRGGSRGRGGQTSKATSAASSAIGKVSGGTERKAVVSKPRAEPAKARTPARLAPPTAPTQPSSVSAPPASDEGGGLLKRMSAAFQKAMRGSATEGDPDG